MTRYENHVESNSSAGQKVRVKMHPADEAPPFERLENALRKVFSISKKDVDKATVREK